LMLVGVSLNNDDYAEVSSVTWKGTENLTLDGRFVANSDDARVEIWGLVAPSTGTGNVVVTFTDGTDGQPGIMQEAVVGVVTFTGVDQTTPLGTFASATGDNSTSANVDVDSAANELVFGVISCEYDAVTTDPSQTERWNTTVSGTSGAGSTEAGAAPTVATSWTIVADPTPDNHWAIGGVSIKPDTSSPSFSFNIGSPGTDRLVVVIADDESDTTNLSGVTVDGKACNHIATANNMAGTGNHQEMWYCDEDDLDSSSGTVTVATSGGDNSWAVHAHLYTGVDQSGPTDFGIDQTSEDPLTTVTVSGIDVPANGLVVMGAANGYGGRNVSWTSPLVTRQDGPDPDSADLMSASGIESSAQTNKTYVATFSGTMYRGTGIVAAFPEASATTTLGDGTDPGNSTVAPGSADQYLDQFTLVTTSGSDSVTALMTGALAAARHSR
jgi:hypothetical protein